MVPYARMWLAMILLATGAAIAQAQPAYPTKSIRIIVPYPPGGGSDGLARIIGQKLSEAVGQQVVIDNRPGAGANIGADLTAKSPPDGYTLLLANVAHAINLSYYPKLSYDLLKDFTPVALLAETSIILVVHPSLPVKTVKELIALAKARPGQIDYASSGAGGPNHMAGELFAYMAGVKMMHIPYSGGGTAAIALIGGQVPVGFPVTTSAASQVKAGKLRALGISSKQRSALFPDLPTISEAGLPGYEASVWYGLLAPAGTPTEIATRLHAETVNLMKLPDTKSRLDGGGYDPAVSTPEQLGAHLRSEVEKWKKVVNALGLRAN